MVVNDDPAGDLGIVAHCIGPEKSHAVDGIKTGELFPFGGDQAVLNQ